MDVNPPFTDQEKRFVLAEAIKTSNIPVEKLLPVFYDGTIKPDWHQMLLPHGRNLQSCINTFEAIRSGPPVLPPPPPPPSFHTQSYQVPIPPPTPASKPTKRKPPPESLETGSSANPPKRRISDIAQHPTIRPKPTVGSPGQPSPNSAQGKKRGRPSKAAVALRDAEAIARGEVIPPPPRTSSLRPDTPGEQRHHMYANIAPMLSPRPVASPITPAAYEPPSYSSSEAISPDKKKKPPQKKIPKPGESTFSISQTEPSSSSSSSRAERTTYPSIVSALTDTIPMSGYGGESSGPPVNQPIQLLHPPVSNYGSPAPPPPPPPRSQTPRTEAK